MRSSIGAARLSAFSAIVSVGDRPPLKSATREEQLRAIDEHGVSGALLWGDVLFDIEANRMATELYGEAVARIVKDPETAASLVPDYPFASKRPIIDDGYYETFNRDDVTLVDLRKGRFTSVTPTGIENLGLVSGALDHLDAANPRHAQKMRLLRHVQLLDADFAILDLGAGTHSNVLDFFLVSFLGAYGYTVHWDDGTSTTYGSPGLPLDLNVPTIVSHTYADGTNTDPNPPPNSFNTHLTVNIETIFIGTLASMGEKSLNVDNVAPTAVIQSGPTSSFEGQQVTFTGTFTDPGADADHFVGGERSLDKKHTGLAVRRRRTSQENVTE